MDRIPEQALPIPLILFENPFAFLRVIRGQSSGCVLEMPLPFWGWNARPARMFFPTVFELAKSFPGRRIGRTRGDVERDAKLSGTDPFAALNTATMIMISRLMAGVLGVCMASVCYCQEQSDFWKLDYATAKRLSCAAAAASPALVRRLNADAGRCIGQIQSDLKLVANGIQGLNDIDQLQPEGTETEYAGLVMRGLRVRRNTTTVMAAKGDIIVPGKDGIILEIAVQDMATRRYIMGVTGSYRMLAGGICIAASYKLELGENHQSLMRPMRSILEKHLLAFCNAYADKEIIHYDSPAMREETLMKGGVTP